jgi:hypothetical protein
MLNGAKRRAIRAVGAYGTAIFHINKQKWLIFQRVPVDDLPGL